jgi:seryl-tRNA synthetase
VPAYRIPLEVAVPVARGGELASRVHYTSEAIETFELITDQDQIIGLDVTTVGDADQAELSRKINLITRREVAPQRLSAGEVVWTSPHSDRTTPDTYERLEAAGTVQDMGPGLVALGETMTGVLQAVDRRVRAVAMGFGAVEYRYPTLISTRSLHTGGYLGAFPQYLFTAGRLHADTDTYDAFLADLPDHAATPNGLAAHLQEHSAHSGYCLPPTMCFHTYHQLRGAPLPEDHAVVTSRGKSFRFESSYARSMERLWDFTIREIVFLGDAATVARRRQAFLDAVCDLTAELALAAHVEVANDPFFGSDTSPQQVLAQRLTKTKYELRVPVEPGRTIAAGSFNLHGTTFGSPFRISLPDGSPAHSACVGIGLERISYALFCQHGTDPGRWPAKVREALG